MISFFAFDPAIRKIATTTNAIESLNRTIHKFTKTRGSFPTAEAATKLIYLAIPKLEKGGWNIRERHAACSQLAIMLDDRFNTRPHLKTAWAEPDTQSPRHSLTQS